MIIKKTSLAAAISLAMIGSSAWAVPCDELDATSPTFNGTAISLAAGDKCTTTTVNGEFILDKTTINAGETVNLAILGLNKLGEVDRFGEQRGSKLMAVVSTKQGVISIVNPAQGTANTGQTPSDALATGLFVNRSGTPSSNPDDLKTIRVVSLVEGNGEINVYFPPSASGQGEITVKLQERESTSTGGIKVNTIKEVTKVVTLNPAATNPGSLDIISFARGFNDVAGVDDTVSTDGIAGVMGAGPKGSGATLTVKATNERAGGAVSVTLTPVKGGTPVTTTGTMLNGTAVVNLTAVNTAGTYYVKAEMGGVSSVALDTADTITVLSTGEPKSLSLKSNKSRITQVGQGAQLTAYLLDEFGNTTTSRAGVAYTVTIKDANSNITNSTVTVPVGSTMSNVDVLGDVTGDVKVATGALSLTAEATGLTTSAATALTIVDKSFNVTVQPDFAFPNTTGYKLIANNQLEAIYVDKDPASPVSVKRVGTSEVSEALRDPTKGTVRVVFNKVDSGNTCIATDRDAKYAEVLFDCATIIPATPTKLEVRNAHNEVVTSVPTLLLADNTLKTTVPEKAVRLYDNFGNAVTGDPAGRFILTSAVTGAKSVYPAGAGSATPTSTGIVEVTYPTTAQGSGEQPLTVSLTAPGFTQATTIKTVLPAITKFSAIKSYVEKTSIPVNSKVAVAVELVDQTGSLVTSDNTVRLVFNDGLTGTELITPQVREVDAQGVRGGILNNNQTLSFTGGRKVFEVGAGQSIGKFSLSFVDPAGIVPAAVNNITVTQTLVKQCSTTAPEACKTETECAAVGAGFNGDVCSALTISAAASVDSAGTISTAAATIKGGVAIGTGEFKLAGKSSNVTDKVKFVTTITPIAADAGSEVEILAVVGVGLNVAQPSVDLAFSVTEAAPFLTPWDGASIASIVAFKKATLTSGFNSFTIFDGVIGGEVVVNLFTGYRRADGTIVFGGDPTNLTIDAP